MARVEIEQRELDKLLKGQEKLEQMEFDKAVGKEAKKRAKKKTANLGTELNTLKAENTDLKTENAALKAAKDELDQIKTQIPQINQQTIEREQKLTTLTNENNKLKTDKDTAQQTADTANKQREALRKLANHEGLTDDDKKLLEDQGIKLPTEEVTHPQLAEIDGKSIIPTVTNRLDLPEKKNKRGWFRGVVAPIVGAITINRIAHWGLEKLSPTQPPVLEGNWAKAGIIAENAPTINIPAPIFDSIPVPTGVIIPAAAVSLFGSAVRYAAGDADAHMFARYSHTEGVRKNGKKSKILKTAQVLARGLERYTLRRTMGIKPDRVIAFGDPMRKLYELGTDTSGQNLPKNSLEIKRLVNRGVRWMRLIDTTTEFGAYYTEDELNRIAYYRPAVETAVNKLLNNSELSEHKRNKIWRSVESKQLKGGRSLKDYWLRGALPMAGVAAVKGLMLKGTVDFMNNGAIPKFRAWYAQSGLLKFTDPIGNGIQCWWDHHNPFIALDNWFSDLCKPAAKPAVVQPVPVDYSYEGSARSCINSSLNDFKSGNLSLDQTTTSAPTASTMTNPVYRDVVPLNSFRDTITSHNPQDLVSPYATHALAVGPTRLTNDIIADNSQNTPLLHDIYTNAQSAESNSSTAAVATQTVTALQAAGYNGVSLTNPGAIETGNPNLLAEMVSFAPIGDPVNLPSYLKN